MRIHRQKKEGRQFSRGFTLVEMLVVIAVISVLAAIAVPRLTGQSESAMEAQCRANRTIIERAEAADRAT